MKRIISSVLTLCLVLGFGVPAFARGSQGSGEMSSVPAEIVTAQNQDGTYVMEFDNTKWNYDEANDVWYQVGVVYCADPDTVDYESLGISVPGPYMTGTENGDGTWTCAVDTTGEVAGLTADTAPMLFPVDTPGYSALRAPSAYQYSRVAAYLQAGFIYINAGCRGKTNGEDYDGGAPWGVTDLKAMIRYLRYNDDVLPGDAALICAAGMSGGGAQTAVLGASGDSELYMPYLESIGACMTYPDGTPISDAVWSAMCWCPITSLDMADAAYEWNMGQYCDGGTRTDGTWTRELSYDLAGLYGPYLNELGLVDEDGNVLTLEESAEGVYAAGSYYDYILGQIDQSLNNYIADNSLDGAEYVASLNVDEEWVTWDGAEAAVASIDAFARNIKNATKAVGAFDGLTRGQAENTVFGDGDTDSLHFDAALAALLADNEAEYAAYEDFDPAYVTDYQEYLDSVDALGSCSLVRQDMYNPMYYLADYYDGCGTAAVAPHWRIRTGITQGDTSLCVEMNLALALNAYDGVEDVDFETVWAQAHTEAERVGSSAANYIAWVNGLLAAEA